MEYSGTLVETERLRIFPASRSVMERFIKAQTDEFLALAYTDMLRECLKHPEQWDWYAIWMIETKDGKHIGECCFKGLQADGTAEIGYGIAKPHRGRGYAVEAVGAVVQWAFRHPSVTAVLAETTLDNIASQKVLEKCGFVFTGKTGPEGPRFLLPRP